MFQWLLSRGWCEQTQKCGKKEQLRSGLENRWEWRGQRGPRLIIFITVKVKGKTSSTRVAVLFLISAPAVEFDKRVDPVREIKPVGPKGKQPWIFTGGTDAEAEAPMFGHLMWRSDSLEKTLMLERLRAGGEGDDRGWDGWMASPTRQTWVWVNSGSWWRTGRPGVLWLIGSQRVGHDWATELSWTLLHSWKCAFAIQKTVWLEMRL